MVLFIFSAARQAYKMPISWHKKSKTQHVIISNFEKLGLLNFENSKRKAKVFGISKFLSFRFSRKMFSHFFLSWCNWSFWSNKMKKYGLPEPKTLRIHEILSFRCLMPWNRHFISSIWRRKIQLRHSSHYLINIMPYFAQKSP